MFSSAKWLELFIPFPFSIIQVFSVIALLFHQKSRLAFANRLFVCRRHDGERKTDRRNIRCVRLTPPLPARGACQIRDPLPRRLPNCVRRYAPVAHTSADSIMSRTASRALPSVPVLRTSVRHPRCVLPSAPRAEHTLAVSTPLSPAPRSYTAARDRIALPAGACRRSFLPNFREAVADCLAA